MVPLSRYFITLDKLLTPRRIGRSTATRLCGCAGGCAFKHKVRRRKGGTYHSRNFTGTSGSYACRPAHCPFRGLLGVHSRYGLHTRAVTVYRDTLTEGFSHFVTSIAAPVLPAGAFAGWDLHPLESTALARRTPATDSVGRPIVARCFKQACAELVYTTAATGTVA